MDRGALTWTFARRAAGLFAAALLALGVGERLAGAEEDVSAPTLISVRLDAPVAYLTFTDNAENEADFRIVMRERDNPDLWFWRDGVLAVPGAGRVVTRSITGIQPDVAYCATVVAYQDRNFADALLEAFTDPLAPYPASASNTVCADPAKAPPDLLVEAIRGRDERDWTEVAAQTPAYLIVLRNEGADATGTVVVDIATSGVLTLAAMPPVVLQGWQASGFTCVDTPASGGANAGLRCTGGTLGKGQSTNPAVLVRATGRGYGYIHATVSLSDGSTDINPGNNGLALGVRIY